MQKEPQIRWWGRLETGPINGSARLAARNKRVWRRFVADPFLQCIDLALERPNVSGFVHVG
jgi:hypothetical protein